MPKRINLPVRVAILIGSFGAIGAALRAGVTEWFSMVSLFPFGTWMINTLGSFLLSLLLFHPTFRYQISPMIYTALTVGAIGSFTTFSTVTVETVDLWMANPVHALVYVLGNILTSVGACLIGYFLVKERA